MQAQTLSPREAGYRMPAEWAHHDATWAAWPFDPATWFDERHLARVRSEHAGLVRAIAASEPVHLLVCDDESERTARAALEGAEVRFHRVPINDVWLRDSGPIFVARQSKQPASWQVAATEWQFNGWGGKFDHALDNQISSRVVHVTGVTGFMGAWVLEGGSIEVNGRGVALTTRQCLLNPNRNPAACQADLERAVRDMLGIDTLIWLEDGLDGDHTDGHIDTIARFVDETTVVCCHADDPDDAHHARMLANQEILRNATSHEGRPLRVIRLPLPRLRRQSLDGGPLPASYANFYITNQSVLVPTYDDPADEEALAILRTCFPGRQVIGLPSLAIVQGGGSFHCLTQQQPATTQPIPGSEDPKP